MLLMLTIFPIANADGRIKVEDESVLQEVLKTTIVPTSQKQFVNYVEVENDTIGEGAETIDKELEEIVEKSSEVATGIVSWYGDKFHGRKTASGKIYDKNELTAAHKTLPFGTKVRVTNIKNGKSVVVEINDRGPFIKSRVLDLSKAAFSEIGKTSSGVMQVEYEVLDN
ncbi:RlpA-like protein precursor [Weeksella virosa]|uniref:Probable endolytic peptidoglycan transglycosylase RlpA n=2 Tax=Weeksella virosa TaxID=1014 RepID=F0NZM4_WEEVC|nr:rare lipoprotein A [Weeksella virosa DSM 16922]SUP53564.1 RlpA-like protein precursor [Weeksella virosa]VEH62981.1 RlpA-like protein precursor [Weeksella virosa]